MPCLRMGVAIQSILALKIEWQSYHAVVDGHSRITSRETEYGVDGPVVMVSVLSAFGPVTSEKNFMKLSVHQFVKKILKLIAQ